MKKLFGVFFLSAIFLSCDSQATQSQTTQQAGGGEGYTLTGKVKHPQPNGMIVLSEFKPNGFVPIDSVKTGKDNAYSFKGKVKDPGFYLLSFYDKQKVLLILENANIEVNADGNSPAGAFTAKGTKNLADLQKITNVQNELQSKASELMAKFQDANLKKDEKAKASIQAQYLEFEAKANEKLKAQIREIGPSLAAYYGANLLSPENEYPFLDSLAKQMQKQMPDSKYTKELVGKLSQYENVVTVGQQAPDITLNDPDGKPLSLSSLRGKYVLLDFWASWCGPCRQENPNVVRMYNKFKNKNFEIFGVSLDQNQEKWLSAIQKDQLTWKHVSDLKGWQSAGAAQYGVSAIPATFLIDPNGKIIAKNLRGKALEDKLDEVLSANKTATRQ